MPQLYPRKVCRACGDELLLENFSQNRPGQYYPDCDKCRNAKRRAQRAANPEKFRAADNADYARTKEQHHARAEKRRRAKGIPPAHRVAPDDTRSPQQRHYDTHPEALAAKKAYDLEWQRQQRRKAGIPPRPPLTPEQRKEKRREWLRDNPEKIAAQNERTRDYRREWMRYYRRDHPDYQTQQNHVRRAQKHQTSYDEIDYVAILKRDGRWCYLCEQRITSKHVLNYDHVIPLSRGGSHTADNIRPTHAICNQRKADRLLSELTPFDRRGP